MMPLREQVVQVLQRPAPNLRSRVQKERMRQRLHPPRVRGRRGRVDAVRQRGKRGGVKQQRAQQRVVGVATLRLRQLARTSASFSAAAAAASFRAAAAAAGLLRAAPRDPAPEPRERDRERHPGERAQRRVRLELVREVQKPVLFAASKREVIDATQETPRVALVQTQRELRALQRRAMTPPARQPLRVLKQRREERRVGVRRRLVLVLVFEIRRARHPRAPRRRRRGEMRMPAPFQREQALLERLRALRALTRVRVHVRQREQRVDVPRVAMQKSDQLIRIVRRRRAAIRRRRGDRVRDDGAAVRCERGVGAEGF
mmetsp:Transcript_3153/g.10549  ORF Transcript_3153/g.10549 Transcript_3153/m.10549 type:complete len:316 (+) Transcript_3153:2495-3442(+)